MHVWVETVDEGHAHKYVSETNIFLNIQYVCNWTNAHLKLYHTRYLLYFTYSTDEFEMPCFKFEIKIKNCQH